MKSRSITIVSCFVFCLFLLFVSDLLAAPTLTWDASAGATGYNVYCDDAPISGPVVPIDAGAAITYDLVGQVVNGVQIECWVTAYAPGFSESAESNHIAFTPPNPVQTFTIPGQPKSVTLSWQ